VKIDIYDLRHVKVKTRICAEFTTVTAINKRSGVGEFFGTWLGNSHFLDASSYFSISNAEHDSHYLCVAVVVVVVVVVTIVVAIYLANRQNDARVHGG